MSPRNRKKPESPQSETIDLARTVGELSSLALRGLMTIAPAEADEAESLALFAVLAKLRERLSAEGLAVDTLSMGMSADFELAIAAGATCVRIGTAIFGAREMRG